jgi:hypothetical protein
LRELLDDEDLLPAGVTARHTRSMD